LYVINAIKHIDGLLSFVGIVQSPWCQQVIGSRGAKELVSAVELYPRDDLLQPPADAMYLGRSHIRQCGKRVPVQRRKRDLIEINQTDFGYSGSGQRSNSMRADASAPNNNYERVAELCETLIL
jgi:hypothetical protein